MRKAKEDVQIFYSIINEKRINAGDLLEIVGGGSICQHE